MNSIRGRLLAWLVAGLLPVIAVCFAIQYFLVSGALQRQFDSDLGRRADTLVQMAEWWDGEPEDPGEHYDDLGDDAEDLIRFDFAELSLPEFLPSRDAQYYEVRDASGLIHARSPSLQHASLWAESAPRVHPKSRDVLLPDGRSGRMVTRTFVPPVEADSIPNRPDTTYTLMLARSTEELAATLAVLRISLLLAAVFAVLLSYLMIRVFVRRGLEPLGEIGAKISAIREDDLDLRITIDDAPDELRPVCERLNELLDRLETVFERERRFVSDVAHELRTPLAELRTLAEVSARRGESSAADRQSFRDVEEIVVRLERIIGTLLNLSRCSSGQVAKELQRADLMRLVESTWRPFEDTARSKELRVRLQAGEVPALHTDPLILGTILSNLFSNAVEYTPAGGQISLECGSGDNSISLSLSNTTTDLSPSDLARITEKFWRKQGPDPRSCGHLGLGLTLVDALTKVLGARVECDMPSSDTFRVMLFHPN